MCLAAPALAQQGAHGTRQSPYAGEQTRAIAALSEQDLEDLAGGEGWGLARPAELNGVPGPAHLLELADEIGLDERQREAIGTIRDKMRSEAVIAGERFVRAERALDAAFSDAVPDAAVLARLVAAAGTARADLRYVHLSAHLRTAPLLTTGQIEQYAILRGYSDDPCASVPKGHDATMWKRHNECS